MTVLGSLLAQRAIYASDFWGRWQRGEDLDDPGNLAGVTVTRETAMQLSAVWACVSLVSDSISTLPMDTFIREQRARKPFRPRPPWVLTPNPEQDRHQWVSQQLVSLLLDGTAYVHTIRDRMGDVVEAWNAPAWMVTPKRARRGRIEYEVRDEHGQTITLDQTQMFHVPGMSWPGQIRGMSPLEAARRMLSTGLGAQEFAERFYGQGFSSPGFVEVPGDFTTEQAKDLKADILRMTGGLKRSHLPGVLTGGAKFASSTVTPEQAQFLESRGFSVTEIARFFRCPPHLISDVEKSTSWGTGIEEQNIGFVTYTLRPWLERLEQAYSRHMLSLGSQRDAFVKFNVDGLLRGDFKSRQEGYAVGRMWGYLNADDVNAYEDRPPLPDGLGQEYLVPMNMRPAGEPVPAADPPSEDPPA